MLSKAGWTGQVVYFIQKKTILGNLCFDSFRGGEIIIQKTKSDFFVEALLIVFGSTEHISIEGKTFST